MDLLGGDTKERRIYDALNDEILLEFSDVPLSEVVDYLKTARDIPIIRPNEAAFGLSVNEPHTEEAGTCAWVASLRAKPACLLQPPLMNRDHSAHDTTLFMPQSSILSDS